ncbi:MAG: hypothetical protein KAJ47_02285 [Candidatus Aenigmarchaeota archaeon]|nr:hypothetical protein [Candidatus Aenigmarchaeota archaeon]
MPAKKKMLTKGKTKVRQRNEKFSKKTKQAHKTVKQEEKKNKHPLTEKLKKITTADYIQIAIIIVLVAYLIFVTLKFNRLI